MPTTSRPQQSALKEEPTASDKPKVEKAIGVLEAEIKRLEDLAKQAATQPPVGEGSGSAAPPQPVAASQEVQQLGDVKVRGLVVIVTEPQNATTAGWTPTTISGR